MSVTIRSPTERLCERCGRHEQWTDEAGAWSVAHEDDDPVTGDVFCLHEWDINGAFVPFEDIDGTEV